MTIEDKIKVISALLAAYAVMPQSEERDLYFDIIKRIDELRNER